MEDRSYGNYYYRGGSGLWRSLRDGEFEEAEVWDVLRDRRDPSSDIVAVSHEPATYSAPKHTPSSAKLIPTADGGSSSGSSTPRSIFAHQSAPVNIPNWSGVRRIERSKSSKAWNNRRDDDYEEDDDGGGCNDDDDGFGDKMLPPHEYIALRLARNNISSFSVLEGAGRKLKGRDLSKVRHHVLTKTGFLESP